MLSNLSTLVETIKAKWYMVMISVYDVRHQCTSPSKGCKLKLSLKLQNAKRKCKAFKVIWKNNSEHRILCTAEVTKKISDKLASKS